MAMINKNITSAVDTGVDINAASDNAAATTNPIGKLQLKPKTDINTMNGAVNATPDYSGEANAAYQEVNQNTHSVDNVAQTGANQPTYTQTSYIDSNGNEQQGLNIDGKTYDANGNPIQGEFTVQTGNRYWRRNADGTSTEISKEEYEASKVANQAEQIYGDATRSGFDKDNPKKYWTKITDADGTVHSGYIINGTSYYEDGTPIRGGSSVVDSTGKIWTKPAEQAPSQQSAENGNNSPYGIDYQSLRAENTPAAEQPELQMYDEAGAVYNSPEFKAMMANGYIPQELEQREDTYKRPDMPTSQASDYQIKDYTEQINDVYQKQYDVVKTQIENQLAQGELDIDQAIEKVPQIYEASINDVTSQYERSKLNANEYFAANGLSSGARAQALLAMNNVYNANVGALKAKQAEAINDYENQRAKLKLEAQGKITEALMSNEADKAQAILAEYQRQDEQGFQLFLQQLDQDYKYYALNIDTALREAERADTNYWKTADYGQTERQIAEESRQKGLGLMLDIAQIEESARQADNDTRMKMYEVAENIREFNLKHDTDIAQLQQNAMIAAEEAKLAREKYETSKEQWGAEFSLETRKAETDMEIAERNAKLAEDKFNETIREFEVETGIKQDELAWKKESTAAELAENQRQFDTTQDYKERSLAQQANEAAANIALSVWETQYRYEDKRNGGSSSPILGDPNKAYKLAIKDLYDGLEAGAEAAEIYASMGATGEGVAEIIINNFIENQKKNGKTKTREEVIADLRDYEEHPENYQ